APERRRSSRTVLRDAAHLRAEVRGVEMNGDAARLDQLDERIGDLLSQPLLHREAPRVEPDDPGQLGDADDLAPGDVRDMGGAVERERVVLAQRVKGDRPLEDHPARLSSVLGRERGQELRVAVVAGGGVVERSEKADRRLARPGVWRSMPKAVRISAA